MAQPPMLSSTVLLLHYSPNGFTRASMFCKSMIFSLFLLFQGPLPTPDCGYCLSGNKLSFSSSFSDGNAGNLPQQLGVDWISTWTDIQQHIQQDNEYLAEYPSEY